MICIFLQNLVPPKAYKIKSQPMKPEYSRNGQYPCHNRIDNDSTWIIPDKYPNLYFLYF